jgi:hypothetical protein
MNRLGNFYNLVTGKDAKIRHRIDMVPYRRMNDEAFDEARLKELFVGDAQYRHCAGDTVENRERRRHYYAYFDAYYAQDDRIFNN